jgi:hypothetical protein
MPEPTTADPIDAIRERLQRMVRGAQYTREQQVHDYGTLLAAYDQQARDIEALSAGVTGQSERARAAEARAATAEAAVQRVLAIHTNMNPGPGAPECCICCDMDGPLLWPCPTVQAVSTDLGSAGQAAPHDRGKDGHDAAPCSMAEPHLPTGPTHHYPVRDLSGEPLRAELDWTAADEDDWSWRKADDFPRSAYMPERWTEDGAR